jgi:hypothetical protein
MDTEVLGPEKMNPPKMGKSPEIFKAPTPKVESPKIESRKDPREDKMRGLMGKLGKIGTGKKIAARGSYKRG